MGAGDDKNEGLELGYTVGVVECILGGYGRVSVRDGTSEGTVLIDRVGELEG